MPSILINSGKEIKSTDPCPQITVNGKVFCLNKTCFVRESNPRCPQPPQDDCSPDFMVGWKNLAEFRKALSEGAWNTKYVEKI